VALKPAVYFLGEIMKARFVLACAASGLALTAIGAGSASAEGEASLRISPSAIVQGDTVTLTATCADPGFTAPAPVESGALLPVDLTGEKDENGVWQLTAETTARKFITPGPSSAMFRCGADDVVVEFQTYGDAPYAAIGIDDDVIRAGQEVRVAASCQTEEFVSSKIVSPTLTAPDLVREKDAAPDSVLMSMGRIHAEVPPGIYQISFTCVDREVNGEFTVVADEKPRPRAKPAAAQVPVKPKGAPETGSLDQAAPAEDSNVGVVIAAGAAALLVAGGVGVLAYRRRGQS
jgi:hypothetical protein